MSKKQIISRGNNHDEVEMQRSIAQWCKLGIIEIGVLYGDTSKHFCQVNSKIPIWGIDPIIPDSMTETLKGSIEKIRENTKGFDNFKFIEDYSYNVVKAWDQPFDYLFIDGSHYYEDVYLDFIDWYPLLSPGGLVGFHDSTKLYGGPSYWDDPSQLVKNIIEGKIKPFRNMPVFYDMVNSLTLFRKCG
jgi:hypothetical protein